MFCEALKSDLKKDLKKLDFLSVGIFFFYKRWEEMHYELECVRM